MSNAPTAASAATATSGPEASAQEVINTIPAKASTGNISVEDTSVDTAEASDTELEEVVESDDASAAEKKEAAVELKKRMKFKINGKDVEREIDLNDEDTLRELLQKGFAADERFQSASSIEKKMKQFAELLQNDPMEALIAAGHDPDKFTESYMKKRVEELAKSPEQLKVEQLQKEIEKERRERQRLEDEKLTAEQQKVEAEYSRQLDDEITSALTASELPKSAYVVKRIAENLMIGIEQGNEDITVQDVLPLVEKQIREEIRQMLDVMPEEVIERFLGDNVTGKLRKRRLAQAKATKTPDTASSVKATGQSEMNKSKGKEVEAKPTKAADFFKNF
jgi:hypothetical protein